LSVYGRPEQRFEQYTTDSQLSFHLARHVNGRSQTGQTLVGRSDFFIFNGPVGSVGDKVGLMRSHASPFRDKQATWVMLCGLLA